MRRQSLILSSGEILRKRWLIRYHEVERALAKLKREWNAFEAEAREEYQKWYHATFAEVISEIHLLQDQLHEISSYLSAVRAQIVINHLTRRAALSWVSKAIQEKRDPFPNDEEVHREREKVRESDARYSDPFLSDREEELVDQEPSTLQLNPRNRFQREARYQLTHKYSDKGNLLQIMTCVD